jgi:predicted nucleic acid-binding protein
MFANVSLPRSTVTPRRADAAAALMPVGATVGKQMAGLDDDRRKLRWQWNQIEASLAVIADLLGPVAPLTAAIHARSLALARDHELSFFDALIVAAALDAGCHLLFSEDLQHGQRFGALTVENPFRRPPA